MSALNDCIHSALKALGFEGQVNDQLLAFYKSDGATLGQINDAAAEWLKLKITGAVIGDQLNDLWFQYLTELGFTGALNDMQAEFWCDGGPGPGSNLYPNPTLIGGSNIVADAFATLPDNHVAILFAANPC